MRIFLLTAIFGCFSILNYAQPKNGQVKVKVLKSEFIYEKASFPECHASTIVETKNGLLVSWFGGTYERHPDVSIYISEKAKGKWSPPRKIADGIINDTLRYPCWNPVLFKRDNGDIILYYKVGPSPSEWWGLFKVSNDEGKTWSAAIPIPDGLLGPIKNKPARLKDGTILYPTSYETSEFWHIYVETSDQNLSDWEKSSIDNNGFNAIQPTILFHKSGRIQMLCRSKERKIVETWSADNGKTWSPIQPTNLPNNNSGIDAANIGNSRFLLVCNPIEQGRNKLSVLISNDGIAWNEIYILEDQSSGEFSYPAIIESRNGSIHIVYTYNRLKIKHLHLSIM